MAEIYRARTVGIGGFEKFCAIKKILPHLNENQEFITMLIDEAKICVSLQHANIVQVFDLGKINESYYIAMEYVHGMDLATILKTCAYNNFIFPFEHTVHIGMQVCSALYHAHNQLDASGKNLGIIHRDISPHNILISYDGEVKIIDFGVAKASIKMTHTMSGIIKGKLLYMAPEQAMAKDIDLRADLFSLGLVLYKMTTHQLPFEGENEFQIYNKLVQGKVLPPKKHNPRIPDSLDELILKALRKRPQERFQDAFELRNALAQVLAELAPGYSNSRLAQFMETYFPPRPLVNPEPISAPSIISPLDASADSLSYEELFNSDSGLLASSPPTLGSGAAAGAYPGRAPAAILPPKPDPAEPGRGTPASGRAASESGGPYGAGHRAGPSHAGLVPPMPQGLGRHDQTVRVSVPFGVSLLSQETVPASAALFASDLFGDGTGDGLDAGSDGVPDELRSPRRLLALKVFLGALAFIALLLIGIFGGYYLLEKLSTPEVAVTFTPGKPASRLAATSAAPGRAEDDRTKGKAAGNSQQAGRDPGAAGSEGSGAAVPLADGARDGAATAGGSEPPPGAATVTIILESIPEGAEVYQDSVFVGRTPTELRKPQKEGAKIRFTLRKEGHRTRMITVPLDKDQKSLVRLARTRG